MYQTTATPSRILLQSSEASVEIFPFGALLNRYEIRLSDGSRHNAVAAYADPAAARAQITDAFRSAKLSPFPCRLNQGRYTFAGETRQTGRHLANGHALHGLLYDAPFQNVHTGCDHQAAWVRLEYLFSGSTGYPFPFHMAVHYRLAAQGLSLTTTVRNLGDKTLPLADGWHPYFHLGGGIDGHRLAINAAERLEFDAELLPSGRRLPDSRFQAAASLNGVELDNSFVLLDPAAQTPACTLTSGRLALDVYAEQNYPLLQVYIPPERDSIALENLSGAPDCFNNGIGLIELPPAESVSFRCRYRLYETAPDNIQAA